MDIVKVSIPQSVFNAIPDTERHFIVSLGYLVNGLNILNKLLAMAIKPVSPSEPERLGAHTTTAFLLRQLAGHLKEGWVLLTRTYWGGAVSKTYDSQLQPEASEAMSRIKKYFSGDNLVNTIRSSYAFHMPVNELSVAAATIPAGDTYEMFFAEANGNCLYWGSEVLAMWGLFEQAGAGDAEAGTRRVFDEVLQVSRDFVEVAVGCIHVFAMSHGLASATVHREQLVLDDVPDIDTLRLPYFVEGRRGKKQV